MTAPHELWLERAQNDVEFARLGLENGYYAQVCFLSQQAAEKALKAILVQRTDSYPRVHSLVDLIRRCAEHAPDVSALADAARILDQYYIPSRYPDGVPGSLPDGLPQERHAKEALDTAETILSLCCKVTSSE